MRGHLIAMFRRFSFVLPIASLLLIVLTLVGGCLGGDANRGASGTVAISGTVELPTLALGGASSEDAGLKMAATVLHKGPKWQEAPVTNGSVELVTSSGVTLGSSIVLSDGSYQVDASGSEVHGETVFVVYTPADGSSSTTLHAYDEIPEDATAVTIPCNSETDVSTATLLVTVEAATGESNLTVGSDLTAGLAMVDPDATKHLTEEVIGDTSIADETTIAKTDTALEGILEAHQAMIASEESTEQPPMEMLMAALQGDTSAISTYTSEAPTVGGGIATDATLFSTANTFGTTIYSAYTNIADTETKEAIEAIKTSVSAAGDYKAFSGPVAETDPGELPDYAPAAFRHCCRQIPQLGVVDTVVSDTKPLQAIVEQIKLGACDNTTEARFAMAAFGGSLPECSADGICDFSKFTPKMVALAAATLGLDLKNKIADPSQYNIKDLAATFAPKLRDADVIQTCALSGTAGCGDLVTTAINRPGVPFTGDIGKPPGASCATAACATGSSCTATASGRQCQAVSNKLGQKCNFQPDCDDATFCGAGGICSLKAGAPTGFGVIGTSGQRTEVGGDGGAPVPPPTATAGGLCTVGSCVGGLTCSAGVCIGSSVTAGTPAGTKTVGQACDNHAQCATANCVGGMCTDPTAGVSSTGTITCTSNCDNGSNCTRDSACASGYCGFRATSTPTGQCRAIATGEAGQYCGQSLHCLGSLTCTSSQCQGSSPPPGSTLVPNGTVCSLDNQCQSNYCGGPPSSRVCRFTGQGALGDVCSITGNCTNPLACRTTSSPFTCQSP